MTYSPGAKALGMELVKDGRNARRVEVSDDCVVDLDAGGRVISVEILRAGAHYGKAARSGSVRPRWSSLSPITTGSSRGVKRGRDWVVTRTALVNFLEARDDAGRPAINARAARLQGKLVRRAPTRADAPAGGKAKPSS